MRRVHRFVLGGIVGLCGAVACVACFGSDPVLDLSKDDHLDGSSPSEATTGDAGTSVSDASGDARVPPPGLGFCETVLFQFDAATVACCLDFDEETLVGSHCAGAVATSSPGAGAVFAVDVDATGGMSPPSALDVSLDGGGMSQIGSIPVTPEMFDAGSYHVEFVFRLDAIPSETVFLWLLDGVSWITLAPTGKLSCLGHDFSIAPGTHSLVMSLTGKSSTCTLDDDLANVTFTAPQTRPTSQFIGLQSGSAQDNTTPAHVVIDNVVIRSN